MLLWTCTEGHEGVASNGSASYPTCTSGGAWVEVHVGAAQDFDVADLDPEVATAAFGAGFVMLGTALVIVWAARAIIRAIREA